MSAKLSLWTILLVCSLQVRCVWNQSESQFTLEVTLYSYTVNNEDSSGECCRSNCSSCNNRFTFCAQQNSASSQCNYGMLQSSVNQDLRFSPTNVGQWLGEFELLVSVMNAGNSMLVDNFTTTREMFFSGEEFNATLRGKADPNNTLALGISVICVNNFTGPSCTVPTTAGGLSEGGVAGIVIVFLIGTIAIISVVIIGVIWLYYRNKKIGPSSDTSKRAPQAVDNPHYLMVTLDNSEVSSSTTSPAHVYQSTHLNDLERTVDEDNPLYFSTDLGDGTKNNATATKMPPAKPPRVDEADYEYPENLQGFPRPPSQPPPPPHTLNTPDDKDEDYAVPPDAFTPSIEVPPQFDEDDYDIPVDGYPPLPSHPPPPSHSATSSLGNQLNPYGEYGEQTIKRVVSHSSVVFDNADYADPDVDLEELSS